MKTALLFPGQGSQSIGMGREFYQNFPQAKAIFDEVDDTLNYSLSSLIFNGSLEELTLTQHAQPALMAVSMAIFAVLQHQLSIDFEIVAGHSLGEYSALGAAEVFSISTAAQLLQHRGQAMQQAVPLGKGAMAAILGLSIEAIQDVLSFIPNCAIANDNGANQVIISGYTEAVKSAADACLKKGAKKALLLPVSAPFHCALMQPAAGKMAKILESTVFNTPKKAVIMNVTASFCANPADICQLLIQQITAPVRWRETIEKMAFHKVERFIEVGAGKVLTGIGKRMQPQAHHYAINSLTDLETL